MKQQKEERIKLKDFKYYKTLKKQKNDLVENLVKRKSLIVVYAPPKNLKSLFILDMCICLASKRKFLNKFKTKKSACLYIDLENNDLIIKDRWIKFRRFHKIRKQDTELYYLSRENNIDILNQDFVEELCKTIEKYKINFIVIDTLPKATYYDSNSEREVNQLYLQFFKPIIEKYNISITFLLHTGKSGKSFIGSQAYLGIVDCSYELKKIKNTTKVKIKSDNRGDNIQFGVEFEFLDNIISSKYFDVKEDDEESKKIVTLTKLKEITRIIEGYFNDNISTLKRAEIEVKLTDNKVDWNDSTLTRVLSFLVNNKGTLEKLERGIYKKKI